MVLNYNILQACSNHDVHLQFSTIHAPGEERRCQVKGPHRLSLAYISTFIKHWEIFPGGELLPGERGS